MSKRLFVQLGIVSALILGVGLGLVISEIVHPKFNVLSSSSYEIISSDNVKEAVNLYRVQNGLDNLESNSLLDKSAQTRADYLCDNNVWSHDGWTDSLSSYRATAFKVGENLEYGNYYQTAKSIVKSWSESPTHDANMLDKTFSEQGMGIRYCTNYQGRKEVVIVVNHFGKP